MKRPSPRDRTVGGSSNRPHVVSLWVSDGDRAPTPPWLEVYPHASYERAAVGSVIVVPGGGYGGLAAHEGVPVARFLSEAGFLAMVLRYSVAPLRFPRPFADGCRAVRLARRMSPALSANPSMVAMLGFSAGGHLASLVATQPHLCQVPKDDLAVDFEARPDLLILFYPVISLVTKPHRPSIRNLLGPRPSQRLRRRLSSELHVDSRVPPTFIAHAANDAVVDVDHSLLFASACARAGVPSELHVDTEGGHGHGLLTADLTGARLRACLLAWMHYQIRQRNAGVSTGAKRR